MATAIEYGLLTTFTVILAVSITGLVVDSPPKTPSPTEEAVSSKQLEVFTKEGAPTVTYAQGDGSFVVTCPHWMEMRISDTNPRQGVCVWTPDPADDYE